MSVHEEFQKYAESVASKVRLKAARPSVKAELEAHLYDQYEALLKSGISEDNAVKQSIRMTGDPEELGVKFDHVHKPRPDYALMLFTAALCVMGVIIRMFLAGSNACDTGFDFIGEFAALFIGVSAMIGVYHLDYTVIGKRPMMLYFAVLVHALIALSANIRINSASYSIPYLAALMPLGQAALLYSMRSKQIKGILFTLLGTSAYLYICLASNNMTWALIVLLCAAVSLFLCAKRDWFSCGRKKAFVAIAVFFSACVFVFAFRILASGYRLQRLIEVFSPTEQGGVTMLIRDMLRNSELIGQGSAHVYRNVEFFADDYVISAIAHFGGKIAALLPLIFICAFGSRLLFLAFRQKSTLAVLVSVNSALVLLFQALFYTVSNLGLPIFSAISFPFVSSGNTFTVVNMILIGFALSVLRTGKYQKDTPFVRI